MRIVLLASLLFCVSALSAQYFQQDVAYNIHVKLDDKSMMLRGDEEVVYTNNSPDTLSFVYFHLWPNAYKNKQTAMAKQIIRMGETKIYFADEQDLGYIDSLSFALNGKLCLWEFDSNNIDICKIFFENPLKPGESVTITTPFKVKIPSGSISRLGHVGESFQITQWYPKPAVYDTAGWHQMPYLTQGEFYSEFGSFDVFITLPDNYVVGATGDLHTESEVQFLNGKLEETDDWMKEREANDDWSENNELDFPVSSKTLKTLHYHQERVHDFGWFADKRYHVLKGMVGLPNSTDSVAVWTMFTNRSAELWKNSIEYMHDAIYYYSLWNGDYPYKHATAVDGTISAGGGMEYPNVAVIGNAGNELLLETVIMHEVGHNWFYGIFGSNERRYPWLDEGLNSYNEQRYLSTKYPDGKLLSKSGSSKLLTFVGLDVYDIEDQHYLTYLLQSRTNRDQPMDIAADDYSLLNYGLIVYSKSAVTMNYLRHYLGDSTMDAGMQRYFNDNKFKHPYPKSLENAIETTADQDLDWFFTDIVSTKEKLDFSIRNVKTKDGKTTIKLGNRGVRAPVYVALLDGEKTVDSKWIGGFKSDTTISFMNIGGRVEIDPEGVIPENIRDNNYSRTKGLFKRTEPVKLKFIGGVENPRKNQIFVAPVFGMNVPNGFMPGLALYNHAIPTRKFTYMLLPMFGLKSMNPVGTGIISYSIQPSSAAFENIELSIGGKRYAEAWSFGEATVYNRVFPKATFYLTPKHYDGLLAQKFSLGSILLWNETPNQNTVGEVVTTTSSQYFGRGNYHLDYKHPVYRSALDVDLEYFEDFMRTSLELREIIKLDKIVSLNLRLFLGTFLSNNSTNPAFNWRMDGQGASTDYAYDGEFFDRSKVDNTLARQFMESHGAFKVPTAVGQSSRWLTAFNVKAKLGKTPIGVFADVGVSESENFMFDAGVYVAVIPDLIEIYLPLAYSDAIDKNLKANGLIWSDLIRFQIGLDKLDLFEKFKRLDISL
jgi:hypothetical protein